MANEAEILKHFRTLENYYKQSYNDTQVSVMTRQLSIMPAWLVEHVVNEWMDTETKWLPKGSELLALGRTATNTKRNENMQAAERPFGYRDKRLELWKQILLVFKPAEPREGDAFWGDWWTELEGKDYEGYPPYVEEMR